MILYHGTNMDFDEIDLERTIYNSDTYQKLTDSRTGLYTQSPAYIYQLLESEYQTGKF